MSTDESLRMDALKEKMAGAIDPERLNGDVKVEFVVWRKDKSIDFNRAHYLVTYANGDIETLNAADLEYLGLQIPETPSLASFENGDWGKAEGYPITDWEANEKD